MLFIKARFFFSSQFSNFYPKMNKMVLVSNYSQSLRVLILPTAMPNQFVSLNKGFLNIAHLSSPRKNSLVFPTKPSIRNFYPKMNKMVSNYSQSLRVLILPTAMPNQFVSLNKGFLNIAHLSSPRNNSLVFPTEPSIRHCSSSSLTKVYTKTGDKGTSALYTGERKSKQSQFFIALGSIDELSSFIGLAKEFAIEKTHDYVEQLERIQCILQDIGTIIATPLPKLVDKNDVEEAKRIERIQKKMTFNERHITELEGWIDHYTESLPPLSNFILPGGGRASAALHVCRSVCRRTERTIIGLATDAIIDDNVKIYINRLSDYLFTIARHATILDGKKETIYIRPKIIHEQIDKKNN